MNVICKLSNCCLDLGVRTVPKHGWGRTHSPLPLNHCCVPVMHTNLPSNTSWPHDGCADMRRHAKPAAQCSTSVAVAANTSRPRCCPETHCSRWVQLLRLRDLINAGCQQSHLDATSSTHGRTCPAVCNLMCHYIRQAPVLGQQCGPARRKEHKAAQNMLLYGTEHMEPSCGCSDTSRSHLGAQPLAAAFEASCMMLTFTLTRPLHTATRLPT
jgi:hypothetical protein